MSEDPKMVMTDKEVSTGAVPKHDQHHGGLAERVRHSISAQSVDESTVEGQVFSMNAVDPALDKKMRLVNEAIDEIGWTAMHMKLFFLNGFGYAADSLILLLQSVTSGQAAMEFQPNFANGLTVAAYTGMLVGALFWGLSADVIGRRFAFNVSLFSCSLFAVCAGASPSWTVLGLFTSLAAFGSGGNLILDTTVFLEFLPGDKQWLLTLMACWWGLAPVIAAAFAWPFLSIDKYNCASAETCTYDNNKGWRYVWYSNAALIFVLSVLRVTVIRLKETPKYLLAKGKDEEVVETFRQISQKYNRPCSLTIEQLQACGPIRSTYGKSRYGFGELLAHLRGLFATKKLGFSTSMIWLSWTLIGLAYPLFYVFLPQYLKSRGANTGDDSNYTTWRNYMIANVVGIFGPIQAGFMCNWKVLGRRYTMVLGALMSMAFFFAYTAVRTASQNLGFTCAIYYVVNIYYGTLYAYTPEVLPSAHRATGNGIAVGCNRVMGLVSAFVATYANTATSAPIFICAVLYIVMAVVAIIMPFEPYGKRSM
ncbi:Filamentous Growth Regulator [Elasticomyces elasticus]|uniref:Major Facilitator superfamily n=1 Tax=Exophiala sideris TaxID=1016849 RepID=A0ABR0JAH6_9EURO|nr:Filamentous Growth Regulator [Elasticomyces elasticus]KAK5027923.1 Major Facilitator superfamily [Exophiala sideris]KAK5037486.1 Filamentous Growth Regulator [Exophiala sideris]KAK5059147.1 Major Facilitator superfamily [Exophiala sideris]KAK5182981.1 Major Facilitator superfamily [Eurotiomycetes sp. CCFEE 6388]